jgi:hypothetical protein
MKAPTHRRSLFRAPSRRVAAAGLLCALFGARADAQEPPPRKKAEDPRGRTVQVAPFAGFQFGGAVYDLRSRRAPFGTGFAYGGTVDLRFADSWSVELLYSRQTTELAGPFDATIERYMVGLVEEHDHGRTKFFGVALTGATRFVPGPSGYGSAALFTVGVSLGVKHFLSERLALRAEARGFYAITESGGGLFCRGGCLFVFSGSGLAQGDVSAGLSVGF